MKALVGAFNQEKALVGAFSVIVQPVVEPMDRFAALSGLFSPASAEEVMIKCPINSELMDQFEGYLERQKEPWRRLCE